jgi:VanZ family protein
MGFIFTLSSFSTLPSADVIWWDFVMKKSAHMLEYALLYFLWFRALRRGYILPFLIVLFYSISDEWHQSFTPGRHPNPMDVGFDCLGAFLVILKLKRFI